MNTKSVNSYLFSSIKPKFCAPEFIKAEFNKHKSECLLKSKLSEHEFEMRQAEIEREIKFFKSSEYKNFIKKSLDVLPDSDDVDFLALALSINAAIWSNDLHLKEQSLVPVFTTEDLVKKLLRNEL